MGESLVNMLAPVLAGVKVALLFSLAIFIHEFGHFLAARWLGLQVDAFAIGFGPALWKRRYKGVEYKIGCVPFGGYVALPQLDPSGMERVQGESPAAGGGTSERGLPEIAAWRRIVVAVAGPFGNVVLAVVLAYVIFLAPGAKTGVVGTRVGTVLLDSAAWKAGLRPGDRILSVNGESVPTWNDMEVECQLKGGSGKVTFGVERVGQRLELEVPLLTEEVLGVKLLDGVYHETACLIGAVEAGSAAAEAGLRAEDVIRAVGDVPVLSATHFVEQVRQYGAAPVRLAVLRGSRAWTVEATPRLSAREGRPILGVEVKDAVDEVKGWMMYRDPWRQLKWDSLSVVRVLQALVAPKQAGERKAVVKNVGGPVAIVMGLYHTVRGDLIDALGFLRMICVNLAILNLMPLPVLDGGHIVFALYELVTRRKPHPKVVAVLVNACAVLLIGLMALLVYRDLARQVKISRKVRELERAREVRGQKAEPGAVTNAPALANP